MTSSKSILLLAPNDFKSIPTLNRYIDAFEGRYKVYGAGWAPPEKRVEKFITITRKIESETSLYHKVLRKIKDRYFWITNQHENRYWIHYRFNQQKELSEIKPDLIIVQHVFMLPIAHKIASSNTKILFDSQEYHPGDYVNNSKEAVSVLPMVKEILKKYLPKCQLMFTYNDEMRRMYVENYAKDSEVVTSASNYQVLDPKPVNPDHIRIIHHGIAIPDRKLEDFIELAKLLKPCYTIELMLTRTQTPYYKQLAETAAQTNRVTLRAPVATNKIVETINEYDIGIMMVPPHSLNCLYMCPNKYWEYIQARLCTLFFPYPVIKKLTGEYETGFTSEDFTIQSMADCLNKLDATAIFRMKQNNHKHAYELSAEVQKKKINQIIDKLLS